MLQGKLQIIQTSLKKDFRFLIARCNQLTSRCEAGSGVLVSMGQLLESQKGIDQAKQVHDLTKLAFVFIPLTYVASLFSMNISVLQKPAPIWT